MSQVGVKEAAQLLRVSEPTVRRLADRGLLGRVERTPGGHRRIQRAAVENYQRREASLDLSFSIGGP